MSDAGKINTNPKAIAAIVANLRDGQALPSSGRSSLAAFLEALSAERGQLSARLAACERERDEARAENAWRPIESAPRNGGQILAWGPTNSSVAAYFWAQGRWQASHEGNGIIENQSDFGTNYKSESEGTLTIWKQLPEPPK